MRVAVGAYQGIGVQFSVTGLGFSPHVLIVKSHDAYSPVLKLSNFAMWDSVYLQGGISGFLSNLLRIDANGFTVGVNDDVNKVGVWHSWLAVQGDSSDVAVGFYTGDGNSNRNITITPTFQPNFVSVHRVDNAALSVCLPESMTSGSSLFWFGSLPPVTGRIKSLTSNGFTVDSAAEVNATGGTYYYWALKAVPDVCTVRSAYTGDGTNSRDVPTSPSAAWEWAALAFFLFPEANVQRFFRFASAALPLIDRAFEAMDTVAVTGAILEHPANGTILGNSKVGALANVSGVTYHSLSLGVWGTDMPLRDPGALDRSTTEAIHGMLHSRAEAPAATPSRLKVLRTTTVS